MNKHQVNGMAQNFAGKVQESAGKLVNSKSQQAKGEFKQIIGKAEETLGDAKARAKADSKNFRKAAQDTAFRSEI